MMARLFILVLLFSIASFATATLPSVANNNPTGAGCVDPSGYLACYDAQAKQLTACAQVANSTCSDTNTHLQTCMAGCEGAYLASKVGCWLQSCWNRVYSCEFQITAAEYVVGVNLVQSTVHIPFYPPPSGDLPGGCECNLGEAVGYFHDNPPYHCSNAAQSGKENAFAECTCCQSTLPISNVLNACPNTDLSVIGFDVRLESVQKTMLSESSDQCAILDAGLDSAQYCAVNFGVTELVGPVIYNALKLPEGKPGTSAFANLPGEAFTSFTSVLTLALDPGYKSTITPAAYKKQNADKTTAATSKTGTGGAASTGTSGSASGTTSGTGAATSTKPAGAGTRLDVSHILAWASGIIGLVMVVSI